MFARNIDGYQEIRVDLLKARDSHDHVDGIQLGFVRAIELGTGLLTNYSTPKTRISEYVSEYVSE